MRKTKTQIATDVALRDIVNKRFKAGIGLKHRLCFYRCGGSVGITNARRLCTNFPFKFAADATKYLGAQVTGLK